MKNLIRYNKSNARHKFVVTMKKVIVAILLFSSIFEITSTNLPESNCYAKEASYHFKEKRAVWISFIDIQMYLRDKSEADFRNIFTSMCNKAKNNNLNTLIVHVRAMGDAMYPSKYYPWSEFISSSRTNPGYDPLKIMVEIAHKKGLAIEAWINPYRLSNVTERTNATYNTEFYQKNSSKIIGYNYSGNYCLALDPANPYARQLIVNGVKEIVNNYDVDGIHMDDYFYMGTMGDGVPIEHRKNNVNMLVLELYKQIKKIDPTCEFGISPAGNIDNARNDGADVDTWLSYDGYVDYVMPQIYWTNAYVMGGQVQTLYSNRARIWYDLKKNNNVKLYVGLALYRVGVESASDLEWTRRRDNLANQYKIATKMGYDGFALFSYQYLFGSTADTEMYHLKLATKDGVKPGVKYTVNKTKTGWKNVKRNGESAKTTNNKDLVKGMKVKLLNVKGDIYYKVCQVNGTWKAWKKNEKISGLNKGKRAIKAIRVKLKGNVAKKYKIAYKVYIKGQGWTKWKYNGAKAGNVKANKPILSIKMKLVRKKSK